jgi:hypothetical protein
LVLGSGWLRPLLVWCGYWIDGDGEMSDEFMGGVYDGDSKRQELASDATIRDFFAVAAMQSLSGVYWEEVDKYESAAELIKCQSETAYEMADAMLKARNQ